MGQSTARGQGGPASLQKPKSAAALDRELAELEKRKLVAIASGTVVLTRGGYAELVRRGLVRGSRS